MVSLREKFYRKKMYANERNSKYAKKNKQRNSKSRLGVDSLTLFDFECRCRIEETATRTFILSFHHPRISYIIFYFHRKKWNIRIEFYEKNGRQKENVTRVKAYFQVLCPPA